MKRLIGASILGLAILMLAACAEEDSGVAINSASSDAATVERAEDAAKEAALDREDLETRTIGILQILGADEAAQRLEQGSRDAAEALGWETVVIDAAGDPNQMGAGMLSLVNQGVDGIISIANPPGAVQEGLIASEAAGIPVINIGGVVDPDSNIDADYAVDEYAFTEALVDYMFDQLADGSTMARHIAPALLAERQRIEQIDDMLAAERPDIVVVDDHETNLGAMAEDTRTAIEAQLQANPDLSVVWGDTNGQAPVVSQVLKERGLCGQVQHYNYYGSRANLESIREDCLTAVAESPLEVDGWFAIDAYARLFSRDLPIPSRFPDFGYPMDFREAGGIQIVTSENVPSAENVYVEPKEDFVTFFTTKWDAEYKVVETE